METDVEKKEVRNEWKHGRTYLHHGLVYMLVKNGKITVLW